jgi:hypothetical protein
MIDDSIGTTAMTDVGPPLGIVHRVSQISHQDDVEPMLLELPQPKWTSQYTHVGMHATKQYMFDRASFENVPDFFARLADVVLIRIDLDRFDLTHPRPFRVTPHAFKSLGPLQVFDRVVVFSTVGLIHGIGNVGF